MALTNCSACSKEISVRAVKCPNCGEPTTRAVAPHFKFDPFSTGKEQIWTLGGMSFVSIFLGISLLVFGTIDQAILGLGLALLGKAGFWLWLFMLIMN